jgi:CubicO group peptidase (beta-lactamase class C family)
MTSPDSAFKYCNLAFALLGEIVARVSRTPYRECIVKNILVRLGMGSSGFERTPESRQRTATGYMAHRYDDAPDISPDPELCGYDAAGGLRSSVLDLAKWVSLQFRTQAKERHGAQVLTEKSLSEMHRVTDLEPDWRTGYAMPWSQTVWVTTFICSIQARSRVSSRCSSSASPIASV